MNYALEPVSDCDGLDIHSSRSLSLSPGTPQVVDAVIKLYLRSDVFETSLRVTNVVVSTDKGTQVGSSFGKVDLPYEPGDKILIPSVGSKIVPSTSIKPNLPLEAHVGLDDDRKIHVSDPGAGSMNDISITFPNNNKRSRPC